MALIDTFLARTVRRGTLLLTHADGRTVTFGSADPAFPDVAIRFVKPGVAGRIVRHPALGAAEAYMDGDLVIDRGDIRDLIELLTSNTPWGRGSSLKPSLPIRLFDAVRHRIDRVNMARRSKRNVAHHYDLSDRLYALFLDNDLQYSCAYFTDPANSLERAQADKKAHIAAKLALKPGMRVLDIGCGWGGMALYLHEKTGAEVLGVTLSEEQIKVARRRAAEAGVADKVTFELIDYRAVTGQFDRIVSVGMFEHVGPPHYGAFFRKCRELLTDDGVMLLHTIGRMGVPGVTDTFTTKYIFPGGYNPALSEIVRGYEGTKLIATDIEVLRVHYALTIDHWYDRTVAAKDQIVALYDEGFYRMWTFYLAGAAAAFRHGGMVNYQVQLARSRLALPLTRDYMVEEERRLRG
ncbi:MULTISPECIES: SAM-dependent methyltransferase [unclassified Sphingomonas]|uniref:SAM-dependent methyltransferase n=1 Tax=unclassified Sphingomonas TaxID=196159 RepID=UPI0006F442F4|nr:MULTISPECIES: cyclopropane-fatty-acyl-phospholipid synthase family protein [unclassified Sphingomonas]KQM61468.1 cyclopropane-fatty-acyl-phospholipid synthase [Sphingomonas sp. Leaf16]KQN12563.1 cyclopropane-fatty-acyl-phospholipid synthase [Sphingomonas sp. Leaf29]KQN19043.1 cyclopropane-fatty-acyl-phospholipid synthase [Sphingomonas sp. Leaf32]